MSEQGGQAVILRRGSQLLVEAGAGGRVERQLGVGVGRASTANPSALAETVTREMHAILLIDPQRNQCEQTAGNKDDNSPYQVTS